MKYTKVTYQKAFVVGPYLQEKIGVEIEIDPSFETVDHALLNAKRTIEEWHIANNPQVHSNGIVSEPVTSELPVINTAEERVGIEIENASSMQELMKFQQQITSPYLADLFATKLSRLKL